MRALFLLLASSPCGCAHRDVVDTPVGWWHQLQGGAIAQQRPPPPGADDPYPAVGTTPAHAPAVASLDLRRSVTGALLRQRNLTTRSDANDPLPPPVSTPVHAAPVAAKPAAPAGAGSATLDAAQGPAAGPTSGPTSGPAAGPAAAPPDAEPELALPAVQVQQAGATETVALPAIPGAPPPPPRLPGLPAIAAQPRTERLPDYAVAPATGTQLVFAVGSDSLLGGQQGALHAVAAGRGSLELMVQGHGEAGATDAQAQAQALTLASLRARAVAQALQEEGVPAGAILLRADAFGRGASVNLVP